ncbi:HAL/PAL/TAL family ammonia-lyase [Cysteiniphilum halobium]|uniref:HAL/PAL/TAL family ammonia-lyase n=1 Tax=Cysteiniphilum halobium TaxID=2219059 RepID=UPI003F855626
MSIGIKMQTLMLSDDKITIENIVKVAYGKLIVCLSEEVKKRINQSYQDKCSLLAEGVAMYGANTGVGANFTIAVDLAQSEDMQYKLIKSHACGVGKALEPEMVRAIVFTMICNLCHGFSGIRLKVIEKLIELLNKGIMPYVPADGSLGYLSFQAHIALLLIGLGKTIDNQGCLIDGVEDSYQFSSIKLEAKEALSLLSGTVDIAALAALAVYKAEHIIKHADAISLLTATALRVNPMAFSSEIIKYKKHIGVVTTVNNIQALRQGADDSQEEYALQASLSLRAIPQVHGAIKDGIAHIRNLVEQELKSATDNPLIIRQNEGVSVLSSANPHGQSLAFAADYLCILMSELSSISERRTYRCLSKHLSHLPAFLVQHPGVNSGYMITQYVSADLVAKNKVLSHPASVDSIVTCAGQEDHVSMGAHAVQKSLQVINNTLSVLAIEWLVAAQAFDMTVCKAIGLGVSITQAVLREKVSFLDEDREHYLDIARVSTLIESGALLDRLQLNNIHLQA